MSTSTVQAPEALRTQIEGALSRLFAERIGIAERYGDEFSRLWRVAGQHIFGGKLVRPVLFAEMVDALGRDAAQPARLPGRQDVIGIAAAIELLHYSFLLHDDVIDGDLVRRHGPNLIGELFGSHPKAPAQPALHWGRTGGILMGDLLLSAAHQLFARAELARDSRLRLLDLLDHTVTESVAGEQTDVALSDGVIAAELPTIVTMTAQKTATYSFELPLRAAAVLAGSGAGTERTLARAGQHLGLAFQLQDDLLAIFGDPSEHGKDGLSDLREGKQTVIVAHARTTSAWPQIAPWFGSPELTPERAARVRELLARCGARDHAESLVDEQCAGVRELIAGAPGIPPGAREVLATCLARLAGRRS